MTGKDAKEIVGRLVKLSPVRMRKDGTFVCVFCQSEFGRDTTEREQRNPRGHMFSCLWLEAAVLMERDR